MTVVPRKSSRRQSGPSRFPWLIIVICSIVCIAAGYFLGTRYRSNEPAENEVPQVTRGSTNESILELVAQIPDEVVGQGNQSKSLVHGSGPLIALVIDDLGRSLTDLDTLSALEIQLSYAVLPFESKTSAVVEELTRRRAEILCHLPMEPGSGADPGLGALTLDMTRAELKRAVRNALQAVPGALGVNNHMGSRLTENEKSLEVILRVVGREKLFYLDSRTSARSQGYRIARRLGIAVAKREVFLDDDRQLDAIRGQFQQLRELAAKNGKAIAIGHPHKETLAVLQTEVPAALRDGYRFVRVSQLLEGATG